MASDTVQTSPRPLTALGLDDIKATVVAAYEEKSRGSREHFVRAVQSLAGGTTGNLRFFDPYPLYFATGRGATALDVDGNSYTDFFLCNGPLLLGHRHPDVVAAIDGHRGTGSLVVNPTLATEVAELIQQTVPCAELVRFLNSGTEAVLCAARFARAFTGRQRIVKFFGHYHGQDDQFMVGLDASSGTLGAGVPSAATATSLLAPYGDVAALEALLACEDDIAAVVLDPAMHAGGLWGSTSEYLEAVRALTAERGIVLVFDEVITGFRLALGGAQTYYGVTPDLVTLGKALGAGEKIAAVAGRADVMRSVDPRSADHEAIAFQSGTANDGTAPLAAALGALTTYRRLDAGGGYKALHSLSERLADSLRDVLAVRGIPAHVHQLGPMLQVFLTHAPDRFESLVAIDREPISVLLLALLAEGLLLSLPSSDHIYVSFAHTASDIDDATATVGRALDKYGFSEWGERHE